MHAVDLKNQVGRGTGFTEGHRQDKHPSFPMLLGWLLTAETLQLLHHSTCQLCCPASQGPGSPKDALHFPVNQHPGSHTDLKHCPPHQRPGSTWTHCTAQQPVARDLPKASSLPIFPPANYHPESLLQPRPSLLHHCTLPGPRCASRRGCPCRGDTAHLSPQRAPPRTSTGGSGGWSHPLPAH